MKHLGRNQSASKDITIHQLRYKMRTVDLDPQFQSGIPVKVMLAVTYQDDKPVRVNDANKEIVILKIPNNKNLSETYTKYELANNGTVLLSIPTSKKDESGFILKVRMHRTHTHTHTTTPELRMRYFWQFVAQSRYCCFTIVYFFKKKRLFLQAKYMDEEAEIGYLFPTSNVEPTNLEIKVLTKKCVSFIRSRSREPQAKIFYLLQTNFEQRSIR